MSKYLLIVDGYNIIYYWDYLAKIAQKDFEWARLALINMLEDYAGFSDKDILLVFDGAGTSRDLISKGRVEIVFSKGNETADDYIERRVQEYKDSKEDIYICVATSDWAEQSMVMGLGATRMSARELVKMLNENKSKQREIIGSLKSPSKLESRIQDDVYQELDKIRRGKV